MDLPKYKKQWGIERVNNGYSENEMEVYLVFEEYNPILHHGEWKVTRLQQWRSDQYPCDYMYFFEIFKYLRKYQLWLNQRGAARELGKGQMKPLIKQHLIKKHAEQLKGQNKLNFLGNYSKLVDHCFENLDIRAKITLVIQKKIGYKYYENVTYY
jgi:hypothetical protein